MNQKDLKNLIKISRRAETLNGIASLLNWDQETYMPNGAAESRAEQIETIAGIVHEAKTGKKFENALSKLIDIKTGDLKSDDHTKEDIAALREWRREFIKEKALPKKFVTDFAKLTSRAILAWREAKQNNTFNTFAPFLKKLISMERKKADYLGFENHPYDALVDLYEPEMTVKRIDALFNPLKANITSLLKKISEKPQVEDQFLYGDFSNEKQLQICHDILNKIGYDFNYGRLDLSAHPFSTSFHPKDSRITTRISSRSAVNCISTVLHEAGHALYEMGLPDIHFGSPLCKSISLGVHESQSRFWETRIGQSKAFWEYYLPKLSNVFHNQFNHVTIDNFYRAINKVEPTFIRVDSDEVTYSLHVILRYELEKALIDGSLQVKDIPEAWNAKMVELLGVKPKTDTEGCLQDIHWSMGGFGYFPTYTLGNLYSAHLFEAFEHTHSDWQQKLKNGEFLFIKEWLNHSVHKHGRLYTADELLVNATGKPFNAEAYIKYLNKKYGEIY